MSTMVQKPNCGPRRQIHLVTAVLLMLAGGVLLWLHIQPHDQYCQAGDFRLHTQQYGFPLIYRETSSGLGSEREWVMAGYFLLNFAMVLLPLAFVSEAWLVLRKYKNKRLWGRIGIVTTFCVCLAAGLALKRNQTVSFVGYLKNNQTVISNNDPAYALSTGWPRKHFHLVQAPQWSMNPEMLQQEKDQAMTACLDDAWTSGNTAWNVLAMLPILFCVFLVVEYLRAWLYARRMRKKLLR